MSISTTYRGRSRLPGVLVSDYIHKGNTISSLNITVNFNGTIKMAVCADDVNWEDVGTLVSGQMKTYVLTNPGGNVRYRIVGARNSELMNTYNDNLSYNKPMVKIEMIE